ncbi:acetate kinase [uncultured Maribacter sp.]|uniref:acetate/propionate family kinase n=1 Tax=uncultured Maribacter sp. TaxID=431308 RepID=UPI00262F9822|nr:acetate kinase [uncultured Maribacter sp.]
MNVFILNAGSSSIKYQLIRMPSEDVICQGIVERIGENDAILKYKTDKVSLEDIIEIKNHKDGLKMVANLLMDKQNGVIKNTSDITVVGHRVVHGGNTFSDTTLITDEVKAKIEELSKLAPLHNPANLQGIVLAEQIFTEAKQVAIFDTAFHQTLPIIARKYAIPNKLFDEHGIQTYGFHGTSHKYVSEEANAFLRKENSKIITIHLGNGCSITAVDNGKSVDTSLGFTPGNGLIMGTRSGDIDHSLIFYLVDTLGYTMEHVNKMLLKESGMIGLTGYSDLRDIEREANNGNADCQLALEMNTYRIKKYIGAYVAVMNGLDAIVFTAGIGENSNTIRKMVCSNMDFLGIQLDIEKNNIRPKKLEEINTNTSKVKIFIIPTNEELEIAKQAHVLIKKTN